MDAFFADGSLRLSSIQHFQSHPDETRRDGDEGRCVIVHRTSEMGGQTIMARASFGEDFYVLSGSMRRGKAKDFGRDSYIRITDTVGFGQAIAARIPGILEGADSPCVYDDNPFIHRNFGYIDPATLMRDDDPSETDPAKVMRFVGRVGFEPYFRKHESFAREMEYRWVWQVSGTASRYLDIKAPDARQFCRPPEDIYD